ncbi:MAG: substrate-binding domain-containing protein [Albidovulum sp.]|nr:substrate-binding domain-containing protein [Albidovulum sp.]MDE0530694.1 substrate-binding domain-containing protein [Albidovulum sp.]
MSITGLGPHGERAAPPSRVSLGPEDVAAACARDFSVAVVLHTVDSDWSRQQLAGISSTLGACGTIISEVVDCGFDTDSQIQALERLKEGPVDAIISIPVANASVADAHATVSRAGKCLVLNDNVPTGLLPERDYKSLISADNFGLGLAGAELLSAHVDNGREIGLLSFEEDFYVINEREISFGRWMKSHRPDLAIRTQRFRSIDEAGSATRKLLSDYPGLAGLFVVWDTPAMQAVELLRAEGRNIPMTTVDLGREAAIELARGEIVVGIAAQQPYKQGVAVAQAVILSLLDHPVPSWVALPGIPVTPEIVVESYQRVWSSTAPPEILEIRSA